MTASHHPAPPSSSSLQSVLLGRLLHAMHAEIEACPRTRRGIVLRGMARSVARSLLLSAIVTPALVFWLVAGMASGLHVVMIDESMLQLAGALFAAIAALSVAAGPRPRQIIASEVQRRCLLVSSL